MSVLGLHQLGGGGVLPVLVESPLALLANMLHPDGLERAQAARRLNVTHNTDAHKRRGLQDGDRLDDLFLVDLGAGSVDLTDNVSHAGLVGEEAGQVNGFGGVVLGEGLDLAAITAGALLGQKALGAVAGRFKLSMRLK